MTVQDRLLTLYDAAGLDIGDSINAAEICAYSKGVEMVLQMLSIKPLSATNFFLYPDKTAIDNGLKDTEYSVSGRKVTFTKYDVSKIGTLVDVWFSIINDISLNCQGKSWQELDDEKNRWLDISYLSLRWDMIESR